MKNFNSNELRDLRAEIVLKKQSGMTIKEIAEDMLPYCNDVYDVDSLFPKIKAQWDNYVKAQKAALDEDDADSGNEKISEKAISTKDNNEKQSVVTNKDGGKDSDLSIRQDKVGNLNTYTPEALLELHGFVPTENWVLTGARMSKWQAQGPDGEVIDMVSSRISVAPDNIKCFDDYYAKRFAEVNKIWKETFSNLKTVPRRNTGDDIMILPLADFHLDKREGNNSCMSFEAQKQRFYAIIDWYKDLLQKNKNCGKAVFFWSQDFFNYDYLTEETTSRKNKQDSSVGYCRMVQEGDMLLVNAIKDISKIVPVEIFYTRSNHDQHTAFNTMCGLYLAFKDDKNVIIDGMNAEERSKVWKEVEYKQRHCIPINYDVMFDTAPRSYLKWGECLFGFGHGDKEGQRIFNLMQSEANKHFCQHYAKRNLLPYNGNPNSLPDFDEKFAWDKTNVHVFFCGHFHSKQRVSKDEAGVEVIYCGTEMTGDAWHEDCGYVGAQRRIECYTYNKNGDYNVDGIQSKNLKLEWEARQNGVA